MSRKKTPCIHCKGTVRFDRHDGYCSRECKNASKGFGGMNPKYRALDKLNHTIAEKISGTLAWRPYQTHVPVKIGDRNVGVFSDVHVPLHDGKWLELGIKTCQAMDVTHIILNGDFFNFHRLGKHVGSYQNRSESYTADDDLDAGEAVLKILTSLFKVTLLMGNHDMRAVYKMGGEVSVNRLFKMVGDFGDRLQITPLSFVEVGDDCIVGHPRKYSRIRGSLVQRISSRWNKHIVTGHEHHTAQVVSQNGLWTCTAVGCMKDLTLSPYVRWELDDMPEPMNGFAVIRKTSSGTKITNFNKFTDFGMIFPDWEK